MSTVTSVARYKLESRLFDLHTEKATSLTMTRERRQEVNWAIEVCEQALRSGEAIDHLIQGVESVQ